MYGTVGDSLGYACDIPLGFGMSKTQGLVLYLIQGIVWCSLKYA